MTLVSSNLLHRSLGEHDLTLHISTCLRGARHEEDRTRRQQHGKTTDGQALTLQLFARTLFPPPPFHQHQACGTRPLWETVVENAFALPVSLRGEACLKSNRQAGHINHNAEGRGREPSEMHAVHLNICCKGIVTFIQISKTSQTQIYHSCLFGVTMPASKETLTDTYNSCNRDRLICHKVLLT